MSLDDVEAAEGIDFKTGKAIRLKPVAELDPPEPAPPEPGDPYLAADPASHDPADTASKNPADTATQQRERNRPVGSRGGPVPPWSPITRLSGQPRPGGPMSGESLVHSWASRAAQLALRVSFATPLFGIHAVGLAVPRCIASRKMSEPRASP